MTENKFGVITNWCIYENVDGVKKWLNFDEVVDLLNSLNEENEQLKKDCSNLIDDNTEYVSEMNHIKQVIKEAYNNERTSIGKSVLKQLLNNIEAIQ